MMMQMGGWPQMYSGQEGFNAESGGHAKGKKGASEEGAGKSKSRERRRRGRGQGSQAAAQASESQTATQNPYLQAVKKATTPAQMKNIGFGLTEIKDCMVEFAKDSSGSRFIQTKLEGANEEDINIVF